jgi:two-component system, cell cycle response regulator
MASTRASDRKPKPTPAVPAAVAIRETVLQTETRKGGKAPPRTPSLIPMLTFLSGDPLGKELPLLQPRTVFGRGEEADVVVADPAVSRRHVQFVCEPPSGRRQSVRVVLEDMGSTNGTRVNSRRVSRVALKAGDKILLGRVLLKFEYRDVAEQQYYDQMYRLATVDEMTGLLNKFAITRFLTDELAKSERYRRHLSVVLLDLDHFKGLNDRFGHLVGDRVIQIVGRVLQSSTRRLDRCGRFGGEEFLVVLPEAGPKGALAVAERIRQAVSRTAADELELDRPVTASLGVASYRSADAGVEGLLDRADRALYTAKEEGRNRVKVAGAPRRAGGKS